ncbi:MAG: biotin transporter BioY, partial [Lachnospiraceae bacterium]|nr:biotin transporter BioY [Lachnospiraceae bacterium]
YNRLRYTLTAILGLCIIDLVGMFYLMYSMKYNLATGVTLGFLPFIPLDLLKAVIAAQIIPAFKKLMRR